VRGNVDAWFALRRQRDSLPLANVLPYLMCGRVGDFEPLHLLDDGALGFAVEFDAPAVDTEVGAEDAISALIDQALRALPSGVHWQWFMRCSSFVESHLQIYLAQSAQDPVAKACAAQYVQRWRDAQHDGFFPHDESVNFFPRSQSILLALKSAPLPRARRPLSTIFGRTAPSDALAAEFIEAARALVSMLAARGVEVSTVGADRLANWVIDLLFPWRRFDSPPTTTGLHSVREAIASVGRLEPVELRGFRSVSAGTEAHHRVASMLWHPRTVRSGMLNRLPLLRPSLSISLSARALPLAFSTLQLKAQNLLNTRSANRFNEVETQARAQALSDVEQRLFSEGERLIEGRLQVHLIEPSAEQAEDAARAVCNHLREHDIEASVEEDIGSSLILRGCLPFAIYEETERKLRRRRRFLSRDFADIHPAGGCWKGIPPSLDPSGSAPRPIAMYSNPLGEALFLDPSKAERNPHALVVGQSGSGKSFFVHDYLLHLWRMPDVRLYLISIKPDYRKLALLLGRYVELTLDSADSLNPFAGAPSLENQARSVAALSLMITEGRPDRRLPREHEIALQESVLTASARNWDAGTDRPIRETILEDVCVELERRPGVLGRDLAFQLLPYRRGPFRRLFNGARTMSAGDRFVFFNLGSVLRQPCSAALSFCVFNLIDQAMHDPTLRAVPKGLIADEVWALVQDPFAAAILERSLKAYRSLGGFALPIVQDPRDLDNPAGRVILVNTATKIILPMDRSGQDEISRFVRLNERELELIRNLRLVKRRYSEFFVSIEGIHSSKGLVIPDPLRYAISTTDPSDEAELDRLYRQTGDMLLSVQRFARDMPYGIGTHGATASVPQGRARWTLLISLLGAAVAVLMVLAWPRPGPHPLPTPTPESQIADRQRAAEEAAELLSPTTHPIDSGENSAVAQIEAANIPRSSSTSRPVPEPPSETIKELQALARSWPTPVHPLEESTRRAMPGQAPTRAPIVAGGARAGDPRAPIPDRIEAPSPATSDDPLQDMALQATLLTLSPALSSWDLLGVRADHGSPQARLGRRGGAGDGTWFEPGDSPAPGWMLVGVGADFATLMSSHGNLVHLSIATADGDASERPRTEH